MKLHHLFALLPAAFLLHAQNPECSLLPGWQQHGQARSYQADSLFEYMDGNAEGFLIYGYSNMKGVSCTREAETVLIDVHEMASPESAWGIFASNRVPDQPVETIGMVGQVTPRKTMFAKDKYYVEIAAETEKDHSDLLRQIALALEKRIPGSTARPAALDWFPATPKSLRLIPESVLGIRILKRGLLAQYDTSKAFLITEASAEAAVATMQKLRARWADSQAVQAGDEALAAKDRYIGNVAVFRKGRYIGGYANVPDGESAASLASALAARVP